MAPMRWFPSIVVPLGAFLYKKALFAEYNPEAGKAAGKGILYVRNSPGIINV
jgi:hypothetical protein